MRTSGSRHGRNDCRGVATMANGVHVEFIGKLVGRGLDGLEAVTCVILRDVVADGRKIQAYNVAASPHKAFELVPSFYKGLIRGVGTLHKSGNGYRLTGCKWIELEDVAALPEPAPHAHMQRHGESTVG